LELKVFNFLGLGIGYNSLLVPKNIIFGRGPNMAPQRFRIRSCDQPFHWVNFGVNLYLWFSSFNLDFNILLFYNMQSSKAFPIHHVKLSSHTIIRYIPTFSLQCLIHLLPHIPCQHNYHLSQTKVANKYNKDCFFMFLTKEWITKTTKLWKK